jgi:regulator of protease activity HflC (stomatin/prohibitin superfamily)
MLCPALLVSNDLLEVFWSAVAGVAVPAVLSAAILIPFASQVARNRYGEYEQFKGNERLATHTALASILGISQGTWMVKAGKAEVLENPSGSLARFGGPGILIVQQGHAVMLEISGTISRIVHSGIAWLQPFERVSMVVPLQTRVDPVVVEHVATKDQVMIEEFEFLVFHRVDRGPELTQIRDGQYAYDKEVLLTRIWSPSGGDWRESVKSISSRAARDVIGRYDLTEIVPLTETMRQDFNRQLTAQINAITVRALGVEVIAVDTGRILVPSQTEEVLVSQWIADREQRVSATRAETEQLVQLSKTTARMQAIQGISRGLKQLVGPDATPEDIIALRYIEYLEHSTESSGGMNEDQFNTLLRLQGLEALRSLQLTPGGPHGNNGAQAGAQT